MIFQVFKPFGRPHNFCPTETYEWVQPSSTIGDDARRIRHACDSNQIFTNALPYAQGTVLYNATSHAVISKDAYRRNERPYQQCQQLYRDVMLVHLLASYFLHPEVPAVFPPSRDLQPVLIPRLCTLVPLVVYTAFCGPYSASGFSGQNRFQNI